VGGDGEGERGWVRMMLSCWHGETRESELLGMMYGGRRRDCEW